CVERGTRAVGRAVVGDDDLLLDVADLDRADALDHLADRLRLVVDRNDDRQLHRYDAVKWAFDWATMRLFLPSSGEHAPHRWRSASSSSSRGRRARGGGDAAITTARSRSISPQGGRFRRWKCRGDMPTSWRSGTG